MGTQHNTYVYTETYDNKYTHTHTPEHTHTRSYRHTHHNTHKHIYTPVHAHTRTHTQKDSCDINLPYSTYVIVFSVSNPSVLSALHLKTSPLLASVIVIVETFPLVRSGDPLRNH